VKESPVPFLFVNEKCEKYSEFKKLILPIDLRKENADSALWCSYFGRFNSSAIVVVAANDKNKDELKQVTTNVAICKKLFQKFKIEHKIFRGTKSSLQNSFEALQLAQSSESDLLVILGSSTITPLDLLIGLPEKKNNKQSWRFADFGYQSAKRQLYFVRLTMRECMNARMHELKNKISINLVLSWRIIIMNEKTACHTFCFNHIFRKIAGF
jgi:hypothetical protein